MDEKSSFRPHVFVSVAFAREAMVCDLRSLRITTGGCVGIVVAVSPLNTFLFHEPQAMYFCAIGHSPSSANCRSLLSWRIFAQPTVSTQRSYLSRREHVSVMTLICAMV